MFIFQSEKNEIKLEIVGLKARIRTLENNLANVVALLATRPPEEAKRKGRTFSEAEKARSSERMKKYWADKKAKAAS